MAATAAPARMRRHSAGPSNPRGTPNLEIFFTCRGEQFFLEKKEIKCTYTFEQIFNMRKTDSAKLP
eukprot:2254379-Pleurochrysis_carterae.AAC.3